MASNDETSETRREQILEAALKVFDHQGLYETRMSDIAEEAGLSKGTLYWYFDSKEDLIVSLLDEIVASHLETLEMLLHAEGAVEERLLTFASSDVVTVELQGLPLALSYEVYAWALRHDESRTSIKRYFDEAHEILTEFVRQGMERGELRAGDPEGSALQLIALNEGLQQLQALYGEEMSWNEFMTQALQTAIKALK
jgi:AcrR family transcriptional regulator